MPDFALHRLRLTLDFFEQYSLRAHAENLSFVGAFG
jgi:hypothetical protein